MHYKLSDFVEDLAQCEPLPNVHNQYAYPCEHNAVRRANLSLYLEDMVKLRPAVLLVGEAPGYRGCRLTGVPVTSERILLAGISNLDLFGAHRGYRKTTETECSSSEHTTSIIWETMGKHGIVPLAWNAFPFHPHSPGNPATNRPPNAAELELGAHFLAALLDLFDIRTVVAVGNQAARALARLGVPAYKVRHPSHGGKKPFAQGCREIFGSPSHMDRSNSQGSENTPLVPAQPGGVHAIL